MPNTTAARRYDEFEQFLFPIRRIPRNGEVGHIPNRNLYLINQDPISPLKTAIDRLTAGHLKRFAGWTSMPHLTGQTLTRDHVVIEA